MPQIISTPAPAHPQIRLREWPDNFWFNLVIAGVIGWLYALFLMGPGPLNPRNIGWLTPDPAYHHIGWEMFRQDPHWHWPLGYTDRLGYPKGESIAIVDLNPMIAIPLKLLSPILPEPFQYLGPEVVLACTLLLFFAFRLFRLLLGPDPLSVLLPSLFFVLSPPLTYRFVGHYSLSNHWVILAAIYLFFKAWLQFKPKQFVAETLILGGVAVGINPYLAFQVLLVLVTALCAVVWWRKLKWKQGAAVMIALTGVCLIVAVSFGFFIPSGRGYKAGGYGYYSMNLLSPIDPYGYGSLFLPALPQYTGGQYEGYNYMGAGILALVACVVVLWARQRIKPNARLLLPLVLCCGLLAAMAVSAKVSLGSKLLLNLDPGERLAQTLAPLRATGRLFWTPYYAILAGILTAPFLLMRARWAKWLIGAALLLQVADTAKLRQWVHVTVNAPHQAPLKSPVWSTLGARHENLMVLPAWQCDSQGSPGGADGYRIFGFLAAAQKMRTNSFESARYNEASKEFHCTDEVADLSDKPLSRVSAYVVSPLIATMIEQGPSGPGRCHNVDGFILCSVETDFGLTSPIDNAMNRVANVVNADFEQADLSAWHTYRGVQAAITEQRFHGGKHSLAELAAAGSLYQDVKGLYPGHTYVATGWASSSPGSTATAQIAVFDPSRNVASASFPIAVGDRWRFMEQATTVGPGGILRVHLFRNEGSGTIYWDDVALFEDTTSGLRNAIANHGFENGVSAPWLPFQGVEGEISQSRAHSGKYSLAEKTAAGSFYQDVKGLLPGEPYIVTAWASSAPGTSAAAQIAVYDAGANVATYSKTAVPGDKWQLFDHTVTVSSQGTLRIHLFRTKGAGTIYWDDVEIALVSKKR